MYHSIRMQMHDFFLCSDNIKADKIKVKDDYAYFKTNKKTLNYLCDNDISYDYLNSFSYKLKQALLFNKGLLFGILLFLILIYINQYRVSKITFNDDFSINDEIKTTLENKFTRLLFWDFNTSDLELTARSFRRRFINYQWITITKEGSVIKVNISNYDEFNIDNKPITKGDIVAKADGIIRYYNIISGGNNIEKNKFVNKGDILIASNLLINQDQEQEDLTEARGLVLANTFEKVTHTIYREEKNTIFTSKINRFTRIRLFGFDINLNRKNPFDVYKEKLNTRFSLFGIFTIKEIERHQKCDIIKIYNNEEAVEFLKSKIQRDFLSNVISDLEKIEMMHVLNVKENEDSFTISILVQRLESIGIFQPIE